MADYGTGVIGGQAEPVFADSYSYNWINRNEGPAFVWEQRPVKGQGTAFYFDSALRGVQVYDGTRWVTPAYAYDADTSTWVPYDRVFDGTKWVAA